MALPESPPNDPIASSFLNRHTHGMKNRDKEEDDENFIEDLVLQVEGHKAEFEKTSKQMAELQGKISDLEKENADLAVALRESAVLMRKIYGYFVADKPSDSSDQFRNQIVKGFDDLDARLRVLF
jgi:uncharacterized coiled-coil protein SlyX